MKILIAEDDPITLDSLDTSLQSEGFKTILASDGAEAIELWKKHDPDFVCLDIMMPKRNGYDICREIRASDPHLPLLFISAKSEEIDVVLGLELGADDFLRKPFGKHELLARIKSILRRSQSNQRNQNNCFLMQDLTIYPLELRAERNQESVELSPREISILEILYQKTNEVVSRDSLLNECWGVDYFPESRTLDQHISKLRKKIEKDPEQPLIIETIRGIGYRFRPSISV